MGFDLAPVRDAQGRVVDGEGRGGDLRPDGVFLGIVGREMLDGALNYDTAGNFNPVEGAISMWIKPMWHHGTYMQASLPVGYDPAGGDELGSTVPMHKSWSTSVNSGDCQKKWPCALQKYSTATDRGSLGYVRDRFEHEFFNAAIAGTGWGATAFRLGKMGDVANSEGDGDCQMGKRGADYSVPFGALMLDYEGTDAGIMDFACYTPGWLYPDSKPFYRMSPFRWFFAGIVWNYVINDREPVYNCGIVNDGLGRFKWQSEYGRSEMPQYFHRISGQPLEISIEGGVPVVNDTSGAAPLDQDGKSFGSPYVPYGDHKDRTAKDNLTLAMAGHPFIDPEKLNY
jgi:hypothetical protein